jgi:hypothetical protein
VPPLICPSPVILDQSFPRDEAQLRDVQEALVRLRELVVCEQLHLVLTETLEELVAECDWQERSNYGQLVDIHRFLAQLLLQPPPGLIRIDVSAVAEWRGHPIPEGCGSEGLIDFWVDELGKLLLLHDACGTRDRFFIGVACSRGFAGGPVGEYINPSGARAFPLVCPHSLDTLEDAYEWDVPSDFHTKPISFDDARRHVFRLGATSVDPPVGDSHYKVRFPGGRPWTLDPNVDPVPDRFLRELVDITGYPLAVIKTTLRTGALPGRKLRLPHR